MRKTASTITVPQLFSPISAFIRNSRSYIIVLRFIVHETFHINQFNFLGFNNTFVQGLSKKIMFSLFRNRILLIKVHTV